VFHSVRQVSHLWVQYDNHSLGSLSTAQLLLHLSNFPLMVMQLKEQDRDIISWIKDSFLWHKEHHSHILWNIT